MTRFSAQETQAWNKVDWAQNDYDSSRLRQENDVQISLPQPTIASNDATACKAHTPKDPCSGLEVSGDVCEVSSIAAQTRSLWERAGRVARAGLRADVDAMAPVRALLDNIVHDIVVGKRRVKVLVKVVEVVCEAECK